MYATGRRFVTIRRFVAHAALRLASMSRRLRFESEIAQERFGIACAYKFSYAGRIEFIDVDQVLARLAPASDAKTARPDAVMRGFARHVR